MKKNQVDLVAVGPDQQDLWMRIGQEGYRDEPDFRPDNILWPDLERIENREQWLYLIAYAEGQGVGRCLVKSSNRVDFATLLDICVIPGYRRKGIGRTLIQAAEDIVLSWGKVHLNIMSDIDDEALRILPFFMKTKFDFIDGHSVLINMSRPLSDEVVQKEKTLARDGFILRRIENANPKDRQLAVAMHEKYFPIFPAFMTPEEGLTMLLDKDFIFLVLEQNGVPAGFVIGKENTTTHHYRHVRREGTGLLTSIATADEFRGRGVASRLVVGLMNEVKKAGNTRLLYGGVGMGSPSMRLAISIGGERIVNHICIGKRLSSGGTSHADH
jgi:ribosomal protein S18 acetylase RimI-like enzyme